MNKPDIEHYKLHWEFFESINPQSDELFFLELTLGKFKKKIKKGKKEIDFSNDILNETLEDYLREQNKKQFYFDLEYLKILKKRYNQLSSEKNNTTAKDYKNKETQHSNIFTNNKGFIVFEKYKENKSITESSRTDLRIIYELLKKDSLIYDTVTLTTYITWLNQTYNYSLTELKSVNMTTKPNRQRRNDYLTYKQP